MEGSVPAAAVLKDEEGARGGGKEGPGRKAGPGSSEVRSIGGSWGLLTAPMPPSAEEPGSPPSSGTCMDGDLTRVARSVSLFFSARMLLKAWGRGEGE